MREYYYVYRRNGKIKRASSYDRDAIVRWFEELEDKYGSEIELLECWGDEYDNVTQGGYAEWAW